MTREKAVDLVIRGFCRRAWVLGGAPAGQVLAFRGQRQLVATTEKEIDHIARPHSRYIILVVFLLGGFSGRFGGYGHGGIGIIGIILIIIVVLMLLKEI